MTIVVLSIPAFQLNVSLESAVWRQIVASGGSRCAERNANFIIEKPQVCINTSVANGHNLPVSSDVGPPKNSIDLLRM
jgi:hypothetical protein